MTSPHEHPGLSARDAALYHQVHPLKLATDFSTAAASLVLLAQHRLWLALLIMWVPSIIVSSLMIRFGDFSDTHRSRTGKYLRRYMSVKMQALRFGGMALAAVGAWIHAWWLIAAGVAVIAWGWGGPHLLDRRTRISS